MNKGSFVEAGVPNCPHTTPFLRCCCRTPPSLVPQYGLIDLLSLAPTVNAFRSWLEVRGALRSTVKYELGTHVGFEDQLVVG